MNLAAIRNEVEQDLLRSSSQTVIYLEGTTDVDHLFALLGRQTPLPDPEQRVLHQGVVVKGGGKNGSGATAVKARVDVGTQLRQQGLVYGIIDGDGLDLGKLAANFDAPYSGPLFMWKGYCIENLLAKTGWPPAWGAEPNWHLELSSYGPYVAMNRVGLQIRGVLERLDLMDFIKPNGPLKSSSDYASLLATGKGQLQAFDVEQQFSDELTSFQAMVHRSLDETHAVLNGKWLIDHLAPRSQRS